LRAAFSGARRDGRVLDAVHEYLLAVAGIIVVALLAYSYAGASPPQSSFRRSADHMEIRQLRRVK
jgi:hypothetical protein